MSDRTIHWRIERVPTLPDNINLFHITGVPNLFPTREDAKILLDVLLQHLEERFWFPLDIQPPHSGKYLVGHRGHEELFHFFHPGGKWVSGDSVGWFHYERKKRQPEDFRATHWMPIVSAPAVARVVNLKKFCA